MNTFLDSSVTFVPASTAPRLTLGLVINPYAGAGGPLALKGSDVLPEALRASLQAQVEQGCSPAQLRVLAMLTTLQQLLQDNPEPVSICIKTVAGVMGGSVVEAVQGLAADVQGGFEPLQLVLLEDTTLASETAFPSEAALSSETALSTTVLSTMALTSAADTQQVALALQQSGVDLLVFAGGDGTARDICAVLGESLPVLGIPAGVKMHSGVFAINPQSAAALLADMLCGRWVALDVAEVRDIDEAELRAGRVRARHYGSLRVPVAARYVQQVKCAGPEVEELVLAEIAAGIVESLQADHHYAFGAGTTVAAVMDGLGLPNTLLGFDVVCNGCVVQADATAADLLALAAAGALTVFIAPTGGQGSLIGRGNQQLSAQLLHQLGRDHLRVLATPGKLEQLAGRPLRLDTGDAELDKTWSGLWAVTTGYEQSALYRVSD